MPIPNICSYIIEKQDDSPHRSQDALPQPRVLQPSRWSLHGYYLCVCPGLYGFSSAVGYVLVNVCCWVCAAGCVLLSAALAINVLGVVYMSFVLLVVLLSCSYICFGPVCRYPWGLDIAGMLINFRSGKFGYSICPIFSRGHAKNFVNFGMTYAKNRT